MCITPGLTLTFLQQHLLMIKSTPMMIQSQTLSLKNALFREIPNVYPLILHFKFICCHKMNEHRGNDLNMFNEVIRCVKAHAIHYNMDYTMLQILPRKQLVQLLTKYYQLNFLKATLHSVPLIDGSIATVPIFNVKALLITFLNDPLRMRQENFASNYDIFTGKAKLQTSTLDEIHTGSLSEKARQKYCGDDPDAFPLALVCFYNKTNTDVFGSLSCAPFICTPSFLNKDRRNDDSNYMVLGYILIGKFAQNSAEFHDYSNSGPFELRNFHRIFFSRS
jgi:hypothetical protein